MAIEMRIDGFFNMEIFIFGTTKEVTEDVEKSILKKIEVGTFLVGMESRTISDINDLSTPLYSFNIEPQDSAEYDFDEL